jgi:hypothetical protein
MRKILIPMCLGLFFSFAVAAGLTVAYNTSSGKYHRPSCKWAKRCTANCIEISLEEAVTRGGIPCRVCRPPVK